MQIIIINEKAEAKSKMRISGIERVYSGGAPKAIGPYSQAVIAGDLVFCSGQIPVEPETGKLVKGDIEEQTHRVIKNLRAVLEASGSSLDKALKVTVYLSDLRDFDKMNKVYGRYFTGKPARSTIQAAKLPKDSAVEMDVIAIKTSNG